MSLADIVKEGVSIALELPSHLESVKVVITQKVKAEAAAIERETAAVKNAVEPEVAEGIEKIVAFMKEHIEGIKAISATHAALDAAETAVSSEIAKLVADISPAHTAAPAAPAAASDAIPTAPIL